MWKKALRGDEELAEFMELCTLINNIRITQVLAAFRYKLNKDGKYTVNSMRKYIDSVSIPNNGALINWSTITPLNVRCFMWRSILRRIPVNANLKSRGITVQSELCRLCEAETETVDHLFTKCKIAEEENVDHAASWGNSPKKKTLINMISYCTFWNIWKGQNNKVFNKINTNPAKIADDIITQSFEWCKYRRPKYCNRWIDWNISPLNLV
ncbi:hypothetical protein LXL04_023375 [Taraxacum kok-saghyz]